MSLRRALLPVMLLGLVPALAGCVAAVVPLAAAGMAAKKTIDKKKARQEQPPPAPAPSPEPSPTPYGLVQVGESVPPPAPTPSLPAGPAPERVPVFAGEGPARASLVPNAVTPAPIDAQASLASFTIARPAPAMILTSAEPAPPPAPAPVPVPAAVSAPQANLVATPKAKPAATLPVKPMTMAESSGYPGLSAYVISHANAPDADAALDVIDPANPLGEPRRAQCGGLAPAVMIDLDPGLSAFDPAALKAAPGLAEALSAIRASGVTVIWTSALPVELAEKVHAALARTGIDPARTDRLLLLKGEGDRKQARRNSAARNWCVIAMAGDRRGDFDEAFDYLRDPDATIPADAMFGKGWFIAPAPLP